MRHVLLIPHHPDLMLSEEAYEATPPELWRSRTCGHDLHGQWRLPRDFERTHCHMCGLPQRALVLGAHDRGFLLTARPWVPTQLDGWEAVVNTLLTGAMEVGDIGPQMLGRLTLLGKLVVVDVDR